MTSRTLRHQRFCRWTSRRASKVPQKWLLAIASSSPSPVVAKDQSVTKSGVLLAASILCVACCTSRHRPPCMTPCCVMPQLAKKWNEYAKRMRREAQADMKKLDPSQAKKEIAAQGGVEAAAFQELGSKTWEDLYSNSSRRAANAAARVRNQSEFSARYLDQLPRRANGTFIDCHNGVPVLARCECFPGFEGEDCSTQVDCGPECSSEGHVCLFGVCLCLPGKSGPECKTVKPRSNPSPRPSRPKTGRFLRERRSLSTARKVARGTALATADCAVATEAMSARIARIWRPRSSNRM